MTKNIPDKMPKEKAVVLYKAVAEILKKKERKFIGKSGFHESRIAK